MVTYSYREVFGSHTVASTHDFDEARGVLEKIYLPNRIELVDRTASLDMRLNAFQLGAVTAGYVRFGRGVRITTTEAEHYHINLPLSGGAESGNGPGPPVQTTPGSAALFMPDLPTDVVWSDDCAQLCLVISRHELALQLESLLGRPLARPLEFARHMDLTTTGGRSWLETVRFIERESGREDGLLRFPLAARNLERLLIHGLLLTQPHNYTDALLAPYRPAPPKVVRLATELMESHPEQPWSSAGLARHAAVSVRSLQHAFRRALEMSPMTYLREIRLNRVHDELAASAPGSTTVSEVAGRWGFVHLGRFSAAYRRKFGEPPSRTLGERRSAP